MKKIIAILMALAITLVCTVPAFAADTFEKKDKVVVITTDNPFGDTPIVVDFGFNKYFDEPSDFIPRFEINDVPDVEVYKWFFQNLFDFLKHFTADIISDLFEITVRPIIVA